MIKDTENLAKIFKKNQVILTYLFGSVAKNRTGPLSDIDLAVLFAEKVAPEQRFNRKLTIMGKVSDLLKTDNIDIVVLNDAPPLLTHRIIKEGKLIFSQDEKNRLDFELRTIMGYLDWQPHLEKYTQEVLG